MIILSSSLPKSASTIFATYLEDLVEASHNNRSGQSKLKRLLGGRYFEDITLWLVLRLIFINMFKGSTVIKSHCGTHRLVRWLILAGLVKALYIYRDPRDVVLSAMDHRKRTGGVEFSEFADLKSGADQVIGWTKVWREWQMFGQVSFFRYEDLITDPLQVLTDVCDYLGLQVEKSKIREIISSHYQNKRRSLNFNKGTVERFSQECVEQDQAILNSKLGELAKQMGYE